MADYSFLTTWVIEAPRERVWEAIWESDRWPEWWHGVQEAAETAPGNGDGTGRRGTYVWRSRIPYAVRFDVVSTRVEYPHLMEGRVTGGLEGYGRWTLYEDATATAVLYRWNVRTTKPWMNAAATLGARPIFAWNHNQVMKWGGEGLARRVGGKLIASS